MSDRPSELSLGELAARVHGGDEDAWTELHRRVRACAARLGGGGWAAADLDDVAQEACLDLQRDVTRLRDAASPEAYLAAVVRNRLRRLARTRGRSPLVVEVVAPPSVEARPDAERVERLRDLLAELDEDERRLLRLRYWDGEPIASIAALLGERPSTVAMRLHRLQARLKRRLP